MNNISITDTAKEHFSKALASTEGAEAIRLGLKSSGCSGYAYYIDVATKIEDGEISSIINGIPIYLSKEYADGYLKGTEIDFVSEGVNKILKFKNPNVENECGCGESIQFKDAK